MRVALNACMYICVHICIYVCGYINTHAPITLYILSIIYITQKKNCIFIYIYLSIFVRIFLCIRNHGFPFLVPFLYISLAWHTVMQNMNDLSPCTARRVNENLLLPLKLKPVALLAKDCHEQTFLLS